MSISGKRYTTLHSIYHTDHEQESFQITDLYRNQRTCLPGVFYKPINYRLFLKQPSKIVDWNTNNSLTICKRPREVIWIVKYMVLKLKSRLKKWHKQVALCDMDSIILKFIRSLLPPPPFQIINSYTKNNLRIFYESCTYLGMYCE